MYYFVSRGTSPGCGHDPGSKESRYAAGTGPGMIPTNSARWWRYAGRVPAIRS